MPALPTVGRTRLARILGLLGSDHAGERDAAAIAANRMVRSAGLTWPQVLMPTASLPHQTPPMSGCAAACRECLRQPHKLTAWEQDFVRDIYHRARLTRQQATKLDQILNKVRGGG